MHDNFNPPIYYQAGAGQIAKIPTSHISGRSQQSLINLIKYTSPFGSKYHVKFIIATITRVKFIHKNRLARNGARVIIISYTRV